MSRGPARGGVRAYAFRKFFVTLQARPVTPPRGRAGRAKRRQGENGGKRERQKTQRRKCMDPLSAQGMTAPESVRAPRFLRLAA